MTDDEVLHNACQCAGHITHLRWLARSFAFQSVGHLHASGKDVANVIVCCIQTVKSVFWRFSLISMNV